jgi:uncharacterized membrane protein YccF (DUF307 family)
MGILRFLGNLAWLLLGGIVIAFLWILVGVILCMTIIGIPFGIQCFKLAGFQLAPFGQHVEVSGTGGCSMVFGNLIWILLFGWELALLNAAVGVVFAVTIVGIPFAVQSFKLATLSLAPFGMTVVPD